MSAEEHALASPQRFGLLMGPLTAGLALLYAHRLELQGLAPLEEATSHLTESLLRLVGAVVVRDGTILTHPSGFSYEIYYGCTGVFQVAFLAAGLIALRMPARARLLRAAIGIPTLLAVNLVRLVSLFLTGAASPRAFDFAHTFVWPAVLILLILGFWFLQTGSRRHPHPTPRRGELRSRS